VRRLIAELETHITHVDLGLVRKVRTKAFTIPMLMKSKVPLE
jgi:hypothetical protein